MATEGASGELLEFEHAVRDDSRVLYALALSVVGNRQEAEDAVQDTMELAWRSRHSLRDPRRRSQWLKRICLRRCLRIRQRLVNVLSLSDRDQHPALQDGMDPDLGHAFSRLSPHQRAVITLHYHYGYTLDECAVLIRCRPGTARSHLARALTALRQELSRD